MRGDERSDNGHILKPGEIWLIEHPAASGASSLDRGVLAGADIVLYDRALAPLLRDLLPGGSYAEPLQAGLENDAPAISARALKLASEGWSVVQLVGGCRQWRQNLRDAGDGLLRSGRAGTPAMRLVFKAAADHYRSREVRPSELPELVDATPEDEPLSLIVGPLAGGGAGPAHGFAANGLAG